MSLPVFIRKNGQTFVNPAKRYTKPFWLTTDPVTVSIAGGGSSDPIPMIVDQTGHFEIAYMTYIATGDFLLTIFDAGRRYTWMNRPIHIQTIAGTGQRPLILPESYFLNVAKGSRMLTVQFTDLSGAPNDIRLVLHGRRYLYNEAPAEISKYFEEYFSTKERTSVFFLTTEKALTNILTGTSDNTEFRVTSDAYFEIIKLTAFAHKHGDPTTPAVYEFKLTEYASGRALMPGYVRGELGFGTAQYPFIPYESYLLERDYRIRLDITNLSAFDGDFYFTLIGRRVPFPEQVQL
jgi:hypothetical protein